MTRKKRFGISEALTRGLSETIHVVENNTGRYRNVVMPLSRIELDPDNPRKLLLTLNDVRNGISPNDAEHTKKQQELESLQELAHTIKTSGVINPVVVYKLGETYRVVAGERRCLASILAGKQEVDARVFTEKPKGFDLKLIQWIENTAREDLTLDERLGNVRDILNEYQLQHGDADVTGTLIKNITGLSLSQSSYYLAGITAPEDVRAAIKAGSVKNLDKAALIAGVTEKTLRHDMLVACENGSSLKELKLMLTKTKQTQKLTVVQPAKVTRGRVAKKVNMGSTTQPKVIKTLVSCVLSHKSYDKFTTLFTNVRWDDFGQSTKAFRKLVQLLESETAGS